MRLNAPTRPTWALAAILGILGILMQLTTLTLPGLLIAPVWLLTVAFLILLVATASKNL